MTRALLGFLAVEGNKVLLVPMCIEGIFNDVFNECEKDRIKELFRHESLTDNLLCDW